MKQPKRLTRLQKMIVSAHYMNPEQWMLEEETELLQAGKQADNDKTYY